MRVLLAILLAIAFAAAGYAQNSKLITRDVNDFDKIVTGAPFSALAILEGVQVLADGTRISRRATRTLYRDIDGRLRRDESRTQLGIPGANVELPESIEILDPVAGYKYEINAKDRTVRQTSLSHSTEFKMYLKQTEIAVKQVERLEKQIFKEEQQKQKIATLRAEMRPGKNPSPAASAKDPSPAASAKAEPARPRPPLDGSAARSGATSNQTSNMSVDASADSSSNANSKPKPPADARPNGNSRTESLGVREIEGLPTEGTRTTTTIAAGAIGNDREINVVYEKWYSKELHMTILSKHNDPRFGEQTYRLTNISRSNQPMTVFQPPAGYRLIGEKRIQPKPVGSPPKPSGINSPQSPPGSPEPKNPGSQR